MKGTVLNNKRKAEDGLQGPNGKIIKNGIVGGQASRATPSIHAQSAKIATQSNSVSPVPPSVAMPYRGTSKSNSTTTAVASSSLASTPPAPDVAKVPKKGSYAEIMARAKASQSNAMAVGVISHKPKDKIAISYKKELKMKKKAIKNRKLGIKDESRPGSSGSLSSSPPPVSADHKKASQPAYKGTASSKPQPTYKGTMKAGLTAPSKSTSRDRNGHGPRNRYDEYAATDEDDLDDVEEDDYGSEESEDMEAGFSDVEEEENIATKTARKEDEEEARLEAKLKSEKEARKKKLEAMAKRAKPQRY